MLLKGFFRFLIIVGAAVMLSSQISFAGPIQMTLQGHAAISFGEMLPGDSKTLNTNPLDSWLYYNKIDVRSDENTQWEVYIQAESLLTSGTNTIPADNFRFRTDYAGFYKTGGPDPSDWYDHRTGLRYISEMPFYPATSYRIYVSGDADSYPGFNNNITDSGQIQLVYLLDVPQSQTAGLYSTRIIYTVTQ